MNEVKTPSDSIVQTSELVLPGMTNLLGNLLGGQIMHWMDVAAALSCMKHCNSQVATIAVDSLEFKHPVRLGEMVKLTSKIIWVGNTSMRVRVKAEVENLKSGANVIANIALFTFVALDESGKPVPVPKLTLETSEEKIDFDREQNQYLKRNGVLGNNC